MTRNQWRSAGTLVLAAYFMVLVGCSGGETKKRSVKKPSAKPSTSTAEAPAEEKPAVAAGFGNLKGQFLYGGEAGQPMPVTLTQDKAFCSMMPPVSESLVVNAENKGLRNVVITLYQKPSDDAPPVHESYGVDATGMVELDNLWCRFNNHVTLLRTGQTLVVANSDKIAHNTNVATNANSPFNQILPEGAKLEQVYENDERTPVPVTCNIHPWMKGWIIIKDNPYMAVTDENGNFEIKNMPSGNWTFQIWHEQAGYVTEVEVDGEATEWKRGRRDFTVQPDTDNQFGVITVSAGNMKE